MSAIDLNPAEIGVVRRAFGRMGWPWFVQGRNLNLFGIRPVAPVPDRYGCGVGWIATDPDRGVQVGRLYRASTLPGVRALRENRATGGVFSLAAPRRHAGLWRVGEHHGRPALVHRPTVAAWGWRDGDGDSVHDPDRSRLVEGRGISLHDPGCTDPEFVGNSSEGCCVVWRRAWVEEIRAAVQAQEAAGFGGSVSFGLLLADDPDLDRLRRAVAWAAA